MRPIHLVLAALFAFYSSVGHSATCPMAAGETTLLLSDVMKAFEKSLWDPNQAADDGSNIRDSVSDADLAKAVASLEIAITCANDVINNPSPNLQPDTIKGKTGQDLANSLKQYYDYFTKLRDAFVTYQNEFQTLQQTPMNSRDFTAVRDQEMAIGAIEVDAHSHF